MDINISNFFSKYEDNYYLNLISETDRILKIFELDIEDELSSIIINQNNKTDQSVIDEINETIYAVLETVVNEHGIFLKEEDILISDLLKIVEGISLMQNYINIEEMLNILTLENIDNEEKLCNILNIVTTISIENLITIIDRVDNNILIQLKDLYSNQELTDIIIDDFFISIVNKYKKIKLLNNKEVYGDRFILNNESIGLDFEVYFNNYKSFFSSLNETKTFEDIAYDLISICTLSNKSNGILITLNEYSYKLKPDDGMFTIKVTNEIKRLLNELKI